MGCSRPADDGSGNSTVRRIVTLGLCKMDPLIELLHQNSDTPHDDLAKMLNMSVDEVDERIRRYEADGVILGYQAVIDPEKIDADAVTAFIECSITPARWGGFDRLVEQ